uniref:Uncharacterized protein n=1 Tax=Siphoviridae sp. ctZHD14 TaxID=2827891 RepID=A0A8S5SXI7_9CAUD|nr:MAG TPA: hypothetical protein [Siphoviridae sp. ctZHD14]
MDSKGTCPKVELKNSLSLIVISYYTSEIRLSSFFL